MAESSGFEQSTKIKLKESFPRTAVQEPVVPERVVDDHERNTITSHPASIKKAADQNNLTVPNNIIFPECAAITQQLSGSSNILSNLHGKWISQSRKQVMNSVSTQ
jgi:hypothetical protein